MNVPEFLRGPINVLPNEIQLEVFQYIPTMDLLHNCRLAAHSWHTIATSLCRKRRVRLRLKEGTEENVSDVCLLDTFTRDTDLPWSAVELTFDDDPNKHKFCEEVYENFGRSVQRLIADLLPTKCNNFVRGLRHMPNLQVLEVSSLPYSDDLSHRFVFPVPGKIQLSKMNQLEIDCDDDRPLQFIDLLNFLMLNTGATLTSLKIYGMYEIQDAEFKRMVELICAANIQKLSLAISYKQEQFANWKMLDEHLSGKIVDLEIIMGLRRIEIEAGDNFQILERFLAKCTGLHTLRLYNFCLTGSIPTSKLFKFPAMGHLKKLKIELTSGAGYDGRYNANPEVPMVCFSLLKPTNFPSLENVHLKGDLDFPSFIYIRKIFEPSDSNKFDTVKVLNIGNYHVQEKLATIFPNLSKITAIIQDPNQLSPIFDDMVNVTEVDVTLKNVFDNNVLLKQAFGFIRCLKKLRKATVQNHKDSMGKSLGDSGLDVLTLLQPVILIIRNAQVANTDDWVTQLRTVHPQVQFLEE